MSDALSYFHSGAAFLPYPMTGAIPDNCTDLPMTHSRPGESGGGLTLDRAALLRAAEGTLFGPDAPRLPAPPLLAFDRVWDLRGKGGPANHGGARASVEISQLDWIFACHFSRDPVMPGTLIVDGLLQLAGLYAVMRGFQGRGRAVRLGQTRFRREVTPDNDTLDYRTEVLNCCPRRQLVRARGEASVLGEPCVEVEEFVVMIKD